MFKAPDSEFLVPFDGSFRITESPTAPNATGKVLNKRRLKNAIKQLDVMQQTLYAGDRHAILLVFQGMDGAGKDSTIRAVMQGINPAGCQVYSFKKPSEEELDHDLSAFSIAASTKRFWSSAYIPGFLIHSDYRIPSIAIQSGKKGTNRSAIRKNTWQKTAPSY